MGRELWQMSAVSLAAMIRDGETTSREVVDAHLERIGLVNDAVNAVVEVRPDEARRDADAADAARRDGRPLGALHGVPFTVKTNLDVAGYATTEGTEALRDWMATIDAPTVERMRAAGAVVLARTNMPDVGLRVNTESSLYGPAHNPWRHGLTTAGSSGGEAAAIATGMSPIGLGNDLGGSLRNPAFACGISSIKPSRGRVPQGNPSSVVDPDVGEQMMAVEGVLARHVGDVRAGLTAIMGSHASDPQALDAPLTGPPVAKRVALVPEPMGGDTHADVVESVRQAGRVLESAGYEVEEIEPPMLFESYITWAELLSLRFDMQGDLIDAVIGDGGRRFLELTKAGFPTATAASVYALHQTQYRVAKAWRGFMETYPLVVGPTWTQPPFPHGFDVRDAESAMKVIEGVRFTLPANLLGLPAACVPTGLANGLPMGIQVIGRAFREDTCLDAAEDIERALGVLTPIDPRD